MHRRAVFLLSRVNSLHDALEVAVAFSHQRAWKTPDLTFASLRERGLLGTQVMRLPNTC